MIVKVNEGRPDTYRVNRVPEAVSSAGHTKPISGLSGPKVRSSEPTRLVSLALYNDPASHKPFTRTIFVEMV
ncbi:hypothetical protein PanWU01x14_328680 [Parasponia andersonii]|uniref:Uncharacterized protein n=1 Tax=Parasponia andersonii TaxID=3476 RepID=A0A2P5AIR7_PARAD|nr:hypothetical protein PanWU01x14_328680 [Parasponia andersonii]